MVFNIVIVSVLVILIIHYSIDYLKTFLNPSPPMLEDLKYKKYKAMIDEISRPRQVVSALSDSNVLLDGIDFSKALSDDIDLDNGVLTVGNLADNGALSDDIVSEDLSHYFTSKIAEE
jgi:hypothetical protein